ncbi:MAG TPA: OmpA family protein [Terracidiphilus sp.]|jgi:outer membrane protein OmpA-like peptidoglycan-associated protein
MKFVLRILLFVFAIAASAVAVRAQEDVAGSKDYPGITRMPGYYIAEYQEQAFDTYNFNVKEGTHSKEQAVEGHRIDFRFNLKGGANMPSPVQILRNYQNAARAAGGQVLYQGEDATTIRLKQGEKEGWVAVSTSNIPSGMFITMVVVEKQAMKQEVTMDASAMADGIKDAGSVAIYGIYFDTGKSQLKPESEDALSEITKLMKANPSLKVLVVGHTDMAGDVNANQTLSQARAQAVVSALVTEHRIVHSRLIAVGDGSSAPVASNKTEEGRAKNRRVELVEIATR